MKHSLFRAAVLGFACFACSAGLLRAEVADRNMPLYIEANVMRHDEANKITTASGNVVGTKGSIVMRAEQIEIRQDAAGNQFVVAKGGQGKQAFLRQKREGKNEFIEGQANRIERDEKTQIHKLIGKAVMRRLAGNALMDEIRGETLVYNEATEVYSVTGGGAPTTPGPDGVPGGRVRAIIGARSDGRAAPVAPRSNAASSARPAMSLQASPQIGNKQP